MKSLLFLFALLNTLLAMAQQPWALKPYTITLPRVTTTQQSASATVPQQAGNMVYNTDQKAVAVHNGGTWEYLGGTTEPGSFENFKVFEATGLLQFWTVPTGTTRFLIEAWGGGEGGDIFRTLGASTLSCYGGEAGGYAQKVVTVVSGANSVEISVGIGGASGELSPSRYPTNGGNTIIKYNSTSLVVGGGSNSINGISISGFALDYMPGSNFFRVKSTLPNGFTLSYVQKSATEFIQSIHGHNGGVPFRVMTTGGYGENFFINSSGGRVLDLRGHVFGASPGGGGGCGFSSGGYGANGLVIIRW